MIMTNHDSKVPSAKPREAGHLRSVPGFALRCAGEQHALGTYGHDRGPARFKLIVTCACGYDDSTLVCAGRARDLQLRQRTLCNGCGAVLDNDVAVILEELDGHAAVPAFVRAALPAEDEGLLELFAVYQRGKGLADATVRNRRSILTSLEHNMPRQLIALDINDLRRYIGRQGIKPGTRRTERNAIRAFYSFLEAEGIRGDNPSYRLDSVIAPRGVPRPFTREQVDAMLTSGAYRKTRAMILIGYYQGFRVSSIARVHGRDVDLDAGTIRTIGKGGKDRTLPLHPVIAELAKIMPRHDWWFPARKNATQPMRSAAATNLITLAKKRAGIIDPTLTPHSLRHSFGTDLMEGGVDVRVIQELMMHESLATTQIYTGVTPTMKRAGILTLTPRSVPKQSGRAAKGSDQ